jgi:hypothetical protein
MSTDPFRVQTRNGGRTGESDKNGSRPLNVRQQASRLDIRKQFYSQRVVDAGNKVPTDIKKKCDSEQFQNGLQISQRRIGGNHVENQDWRKDEVDVLPESTIVSERSQWDQRDSTLNSKTV